MCNPPGQDNFSDKHDNAIKLTHTRLQLHHMVYVDRGAQMAGSYSIGHCILFSPFGPDSIE
jgi:hypothetical protein